MGGLRPIGFRVREFIRLFYFSSSVSNRTSPIFFRRMASLTPMIPRKSIRKASAIARCKIATALLSC